MAKRDQFNRERAAAILVEASLSGDAKTAERHDVTTRTLQNWRNRLSQDEQFSSLFAAKKKAAEKEWADGLAPAIRASIDFLLRAATSADVNDPNVIHAIAGALKILSGVATTSRVLDARLLRRPGAVGPPGEATGQVPAPGTDPAPAVH